MLEAVTFQDGVLQVLKKAERAFYRHAYAKLDKKRAAFEEQGRTYPVYPELPPESSVLIYKPDDIGDAVYALPAIKQLKAAHPQIKLYLLCQDKTKSLYERTGLFEQVVGISVKTRWLRFQSFDLDKALDSFPVERFDLAVFLRTYPAYFASFKKVPAKQKVLPEDPRLKLSSPFKAFVTPHAHQSDQMSQILERVSSQFSRSFEFPAFHWTNEDKTALATAFGSQVPVRYFVIHPYARFETRRYPYEYWRDLLFKIQKKFCVPLVIVGGGEDRPLGIEGAIEIQGKLGLTETGYLISKSSGFIGNESGPAHWAAMLKIPTVMIMSGHSHLSEWEPLGKSLVLRKPVPCENCYLRACPKYHVRCLTEMKPEDLFPKIVTFFQ